MDEPFRADVTIRGREWRAALRAYLRQRGVDIGEDDAALRWGVDDETGDLFFEIKGAVFAPPVPASAPEPAVRAPRRPELVEEVDESEGDHVDDNPTLVPRDPSKRPSPEDLRRLGNTEAISHILKDSQKLAAGGLPLPRGRPTRQDS